MRIMIVFALFGVVILARPAHAYIEIPHTLGRCVSDSTNIVLMEVTRVNREKGMIIYRKVADLKGTYPKADIKHNIGKRGFHEREWKTIMTWAEPGKKAVFMFNGQGSETCTGGYWYQCYQEGDWWGMSHAEPFLLRTFMGDCERLAEAILKIQKGEDVIVPCLADGPKDQLHLRKGKPIRTKASLKRIEYDPKRDFVANGFGDGNEPEAFRAVTLLPIGAKGWRYLPAKAINLKNGAWVQSDFSDAMWLTGVAPIGYGEDKIITTVPEQGEDFVFRQRIQVPAELLQTPGVSFRIGVASDNCAQVWLNGKLIHDDGNVDHEFEYFNSEIDLPKTALKPGVNIMAILVRNTKGSSDLFLDAEMTASVPVPKTVKPMPMGATPTTPTLAEKTKTLEFKPDPTALTIDEATRTIALKAKIAPRKLPNLDDRYPIEVIATWPTPRGQKAHETVVIFDGVKPSDVHAALVKLGLKPGKPAVGEGTQAAGPMVTVMLELPTPDGKTMRVPLESVLIQRNGGKPMIPLKWHFTGSAMRQPDPEKDDQVYAADLTGTLLSLFPVTDATVFQTPLTMAEESKYKLDTNVKKLPPEGTPVRLLFIVEK